MEEYDMEGETLENIGIYINGISYSYLVSKSEKDKEKLIIKLYDPTPKSKIYFIYESDFSKIKKDIKFLEFCENLDEIIVCLNDIFNKGNAQVEDNHGEYYLKLKFIISGITKSSL